MVPAATFKRKMLDLANCLPTREGSLVEATARETTYYQRLGDLHESDFVEACDRILWEDDWFPTIGRIRDVARICNIERNRRREALEAAKPVIDLVCASCHGARWVRLGGYDPQNMHAGEDGSRAQPCPRCTTGRRHDPGKERAMIAREGGTPNPNPNYLPDLDGRSFTVPRTADGRVDMDALYVQSRILRGLDPTVDERPQPVSGWGTVARARRLEEVPA